MNLPAAKVAPRLVTIDADNAGRRLDNFLLAELKGLPRARVYRMIRRGEVRINKGRCKPTTRLAEGDVVRVPPVLRQADDRQPAAGQGAWLLERIVFEDDALLVVDKPAGLAVHGGSGISFGAIELLRAARPDCRYLELVHRLDRDTSGCLLVAKRRSALRALHEQLRSGEIDKTYLTLLAGDWHGEQREVDYPLVVEHRQNGERHVRTGDDGKPARTRFRVVERFPHAVYCRVDLLTGRTHQIRVHAAACDCPVAGDERYGSAAADRHAGYAAKRLFLHAAELGFMHPRSGARVTVGAPLPNELVAALAAMRND